MYTNPLSTLMSLLSFSNYLYLRNQQQDKKEKNKNAKLKKKHIYADDTQLFFSF